MPSWSGIDVAHARGAQFIAREGVMRSTARGFVVVALVIAGLAAVSTIAVARGRVAEVRDPEWLAALTAMDEALARHDRVAAVQAWRRARELALRSRGWRGPAEAAEAELRLAVAMDRMQDARPHARELLLVALFRARAEGAVDGVLHAAEGFARLGDRDAALLALRIADNTAARSGADADRARVRLLSERLRRPAVMPAAALSSGS
jgi:hypothetical protein